MCDDGHSSHWPAPVLHDFEPAVPIALEPVDSIELITLMDNVTDVFMPDQGPAKRAAVVLRGTRPAGLMEAGWVPEQLIAEHGFSMLVTVTKGGRSHRILFDAGTSPHAVVENMRRLEVDPGSIEAIVCSHGHFDHTTGLRGLVRPVGRTRMPVLIHPHFWRRRRVIVPGIEPLEIPTTSRRGLVEAGFEIIEEQQPSFLLDG